MALSQVVIAQLWRSAVAMATRDGPRASIDNIARRLYNRQPNPGEEPYLSFRNIAVSAVNAANTARQMQNNPGVAPAGRDLPIDPSISSAEPQYQYRVLVRATDPNTGEVFETAVFIQSDVPLSENQLADAAEQSFRDNQLERDYRARINAVGNNPAIEVTVLSAGRRR